MIDLTTFGGQSSTGVDASPMEDDAQMHLDFGFLGERESVFDIDT